MSRRHILMACHRMLPSELGLYRLMLLLIFRKVDNKPARRQSRRKKEERETESDGKEQILIARQLSICRPPTTLLEYQCTLPPGRRTEEKAQGAAEKGKTTATGPALYRP
ncbi:unnamed protein product [Pleuronectes platessa]|uniref:Uncharacterized protein n=1 Tax=Pleuronectes platessa TaxID=8262 RepID=A0A9N7Z1P0_PLEPL|nr:unnamed protein product [Pleuronectes platessa]